MFAQKFDLSKEEIKIKFAGEAAADNGGPFQECLCRFMEQIPEIIFMFFGNENALRLTSDTESVMNKRYVPWQLTVMSIITVNRRPKRLHPAVVRSLFYVT